MEGWQLLVEMINKFQKIATGRDLVLIKSHRNTTPLLNKLNRQCYIFISTEWLWKVTAIAGRRSKTRYRLLWVILTILNPSGIIDINWIEKRHTMYRVWANRHGKKFIVVQHGSYVGGVVKDSAHKYVNCTTFLVWSSFFKKQFEKYNRGKTFDCIVFGNPVYNDFDRSKISFPEHTSGKKILVVLSLIQGDRLVKLYDVMKKLDHLGFDITVKEHTQQGTFSESINGYRKETGLLYTILRKQQYDIIMSDVSSALLDAVFLKNRVIYFSPDDSKQEINNNLYSKFLLNLAYHIDEINSEEFIRGIIDLEGQEKLLRVLLDMGKKRNCLKGIIE